MSMVQTSPSSFATCTEHLRPQIDAALAARLVMDARCPPRLQEAMAYSLLAPGKRLRPILTLLASEACGGEMGRAMPAASAVEMVHAYSLIHDDLPAMDDDDLRRGRPTCHKAFGEALAILAGDALLALAFEVLATEIQPPRLAATCCAALAAAAGACQLVGGQADDLAACERKGTGSFSAEGDSPVFAGTRTGTVPAEISPDQQGLAELEAIHQRKTGAMISVSLRLGAMTAGAKPRQLAALDQYGHKLGLAFQITDDLLDVRSTEAATGKRVGKDADRGKLTFPRLLGLEASAARAKQLIAEACETLVPFGAQAAGLDALARYVLERNR
jgi:geranylgeranyl diphosphate synthase, type II